MSKEVLESVKDLAGREVFARDTVAYIRPYYSELQIGVVEKVTPKGVTIKDVTSRRNKGLSRTSNQFIKIT